MQVPDFQQHFLNIRDQFSGLNPNDPSMWPALPRISVYFGIGIAVLMGVIFLWVLPVKDELNTAREQERVLRDNYSGKLIQVASLGELKKQLEQVRFYVAKIETQLPSKAEMDALLSDINQAGLGRSLQFELFRPGQASVKDYYAELPISVRITGRYHDIALFASDVAHLSRIVTLSDISLQPAKDREGFLTLDGVAKTYRYLDADEIRIQKESLKPKKGAQ